MRAFDNGAFYTVQVTVAEVRAVAESIVRDHNAVEAMREALITFLGHATVREGGSCLFCDYVMSPDEEGEVRYHDPKCPITKARAALAQAGRE